MAREDVADGIEGDGPPVVLLEVRLDGLGGAVGEEAEEVPGAVRVRAARRKLDARAGAPGAAAGLPPQADGDPRGAEALVDKGRVVQERAQRGGHLVDDTGPDLFVVRDVRAHLRLVVEAADEHTGRGEEDGEVVTRAVVHQGHLRPRPPGGGEGVAGEPRVAADRLVQHGQRTQVRAELGGVREENGGRVHGVHGLM